MDILNDYHRYLTRRQFFGAGVSSAVGWAALTSLAQADATKPLPGLAHHEPKAKHVIYLHMVGGPSQIDLFDYKPKMQEWYDKDLPDSVRKGQRLTTMTSGQAGFPMAQSKYKFAQTGKAGMGLSGRLPWKARRGDDLCLFRSFTTEAINPEPAI